MQENTKAYRIHEGGWAEMDATLIPELRVEASLMLGVNHSARAVAYKQDDLYIIISEAIPGDEVCLVVDNYQQLLRVLSDLSSVIGCDLATRMHTDLQAQIEDANEQVMEVVKESNERKSKGKTTSADPSTSSARFLGRAHD